MNDAPRRPFDLEAYERLVRERCFLCEVVEGNPANAHDLVFEDDRSIAFLDRFPAHLGHTLVAPKAHLEQVTGDFSSEEFLRLQQQVVFDVAQAVRRATSPEHVSSAASGANRRTRMSTGTSFRFRRASRWSTSRSMCSCAKRGTSTWTLPPRRGWPGR